MEKPFYPSHQHRLQHEFQLKKDLLAEIRGHMTTASELLHCRLVVFYLTKAAAELDKILRKEHH